MAQYQSFPGAAGDSRTLDKLKALRLPHLEGRTFLDVGCNEGFFCGFAHHLGASRSVGIDHSREFIQRARRRFPGCEFFHQGWDALPDGEFDVILLASALHYAEDQPALVDRLVERLAPDGVLVLELGIASSSRCEWVTVERGIDQRQFPSMSKLREMLTGYAWKWMGPSVSQSGDPVKRHVIHVSRRRPMAYLLLEPPGFGKSSIASRLFPGSGVRIISGDSRLNLAAGGEIQTPEALKRHFADFSPFSLDRIIEGIFDAGQGRELLDLWLGELDGKDLALEVYVPAARQREVVDLLREAGYLPVLMKWDRVGPPAMPAEDIARQGEEFYLSLASGTADSYRQQEPGVGAPAFKPVGFVDEILLRNAALTVRGWAITDRGDLPQRFMVRLGDRIVEAGRVEKLLRPDVQRHLSLPHALVGYRFTVPANVESMKELGASFECVAPDSGAGAFRLAKSVTSLFRDLDAGDETA